MSEVNLGMSQSLEAIPRVKADIEAAKSELQDARSLIAADKKKEAKQKLDACIKSLKAGRANVDSIDDDGILERLIISAILSIVPLIGSLAMQIGFYYSWYTLRSTTAKGATYSKNHPGWKPNIVWEFFLGSLQAKGWSRSTLVHAYDKVISECETLRNQL